MDVIEAIKALGVGGNSAISWTFKCMDIAEDEIAKAKEADTENAELIDSVFTHACPSEILSSLQSEDLYRAHIKELIQRLVQGTDLSLGTGAEVIATISQMSVKAPLVIELLLLQMRLFKRHLPEYAKKLDIDGNKVGFECYDGAVDDWHSKLATKMQVPGRKIKRQKRKAA